MLLAAQDERDSLITAQDTLASERGQLAERLTALDGEKQRLSLELDTATKRIAEAQHEAATQAAGRAELTISNTALSTERDDLHGLLSALSAEHASLATERDALASEREKLLVAIQEIHASSCWKVTRPLRLVGEFIKK